MPEQEGLHESSGASISHIVLHILTIVLQCLVRFCRLLGVGTPPDVKWVPVLRRPSLVLSSVRLLFANDDNLS